MPLKQPVLLTVLIETGVRRWFIGSIDFEGQTLPLLRSTTADFEEYLDLSFDEQVSFLRHRFAGVLQQGCERLWHHEKKPACIVFVADGPFDSARPELSQRVAEHFVTWLTNPPVTFLLGADGFPHPSLRPLAGELTQEQQEAFEIGLPVMVAKTGVVDIWEQFHRRRK